MMGMQSPHKGASPGQVSTAALAKVSSGSSDRRGGATLVEVGLHGIWRFVIENRILEIGKGVI